MRLRCAASRVARGADREALANPVDPRRAQLDSARPEAPRTEQRDQVCGDVADYSSDRLRGPDRLKQSPLRHRRLERHHRHDRFGDPAKRLVEPLDRGEPEPASERRARHRQKISDAIQTEPTRPGDRVRLEP